MLPGARIPRGPPKAPGAPRPSSDEDIPPTGEIPRMTKSARQLANLTAANWSTSANWRRPSANWRTSSPPTGQPHRRQLVNLIGANWRTSPAPTGEPHRRQLVNLTGANWATSSPPTGQPHRRQLAKPSPTGEIPQMTKTIRQLAKHPPMLAPSCENI